MTHSYASRVAKNGHFPGERFWAAGFRVSAHATKVVRDAPPVLVEFTCGRTDMADELEARKASRFSSTICPVGPDGGPILKKRWSTNDVDLFRDKADADRYYEERIQSALDSIRTIRAGLDALERKALEARARHCANG